MDFKRIGEHLRSQYSATAQKYRSDDEIEVTSEHHRHLRSILRLLSSSFGRPITVLDVGCGTGRYFHCLRNVDRLVGIDVCEEMLRIATNPVRREEVTARKIELRCENIYLASFPTGSFDLIYSLGMFGHGCPVTVELCNRFYDWLTPGGQLFFDTVDTRTLSVWHRTRRKVRQGIYPLLPASLKRALDRRVGVPFCSLTKKELQRVLRASIFVDFSVSSRACHSPLWQGKHLECAASKPNNHD